MRRRIHRRHFSSCILLLLLLLIIAYVAVQHFGGILYTAKPDPNAWNLTLVNSTHPLPEDWSVELTELSNGECVDARIYPELQEMFDSARAAGIYPIVASGYRSEAEQARIMEDNIQEYLDQGYSMADAEEEAMRWVAVPGTSEHQLGLAVDINADGINSTGWEVYDWLEEHCWEYGFIRRYPDDKTDITGISNEPWHYRYVGVDAARAITKANLCLEEYLDQLNHCGLAGENAGQSGFSSLGWRQRPVKGPAIELAEPVPGLLVKDSSGLQAGKCLE